MPALMIPLNKINGWNGMQLYSSVSIYAQLLCNRTLPEIKICQEKVHFCWTKEMKVHYQVETMPFLMKPIHKNNLAWWSKKQTIIFYFFIYGQLLCKMSPQKDSNTSLEKKNIFVKQTRCFMFVGHNWVFQLSRDSDTKLSL